jgi:hypothetical protein
MRSGVGYLLWVHDVETRNMLQRDSTLRGCPTNYPDHTDDHRIMIMTLSDANFSNSLLMLDNRCIALSLPGKYDFSQFPHTPLSINHTPSYLPIPLQPQLPPQRHLRRLGYLHPPGTPFLGVTCLQPNQIAPTSINMSVAPMLNVCSVDAMRHLDIPPTPNLCSVDAMRHLNTPSTLNLSRTTTTSDTPHPPGDFVLGAPSEGTIAKRRQLVRAIRELAHRQLRSHRSGIFRLELDTRSCSLERPLESSAVTQRRTQHRAATTKRRAVKRVRSRASLSSQRLLAKKASLIGSEMVFFGEFKANPRARYLPGCAVM